VKTGFFSKPYLDTSIIGYLYQETQTEKMADTQKLWEQIKNGVYEVLISNLLLEELSNNPNEEVTDKKDNITRYIYDGNGNTIETKLLTL